MSFQDAVRTCLNKYGTFTGRARRSEFWFFWLFNVLVQSASSILDAIVFSEIQPITALTSLALLLPGLAVAVRRLHDNGRSGWWILIGLVPLVGWIVLLVWYLSRGGDGPNRFGPDPRDASGPGWGAPPPPSMPRSGGSPPGGGGRPWPVSPPRAAP
ncbi:DUF805 domain-containing protein [Roseomonas sp. AR75]|uniref:DUF805 domain-containing protein n=1 Tax=Roseomonas sp. AR75 TaxID=2562311 RepID=UPI0010BFB14B|nr:DUF805 domain-containing protein [Roseomonas sp. AR75]